MQGYTFASVKPTRKKTEDFIQRIETDEKNFKLIDSIRTEPIKLGFRKRTLEDIMLRKDMMTLKFFKKLERKTLFY